MLREPRLLFKEIWQSSFTFIIQYVSNKEKFGYQGNPGTLKTELSFKGNILSHKNYRK